MGSICELRDSTGDREADRAVALVGEGAGGGVRDNARGLFRAEAVGEAPGEDGSTVDGSPKSPRTVSSSEGPLCSTSLRRDERKEGASSAVGEE